MLLNALQAEHENDYLEVEHHDISTSCETSQASLQQPSKSSTAEVQQTVAAGRAEGEPHTFGDAVSSSSPGQLTRAAYASRQATAEQYGSKSDTAPSGASKEQLPGRSELHDRPAVTEATDKQREQPQHASSSSARLAFFLI